MHLASGLSVGLAGIAAGYTIGVVGDAVSMTLKAEQYIRCLFTFLGCSFVHATIPCLRWNDFDLDFRRSLGTLRVCLSLYSEE